MLGFLFAAALILTNLGNAEMKRVERDLANDIRSRLEGGAGDVSVQLRLNGIFGGASGDLASATVKGSQFTASGLPLLVQPSGSKRGRIGSLRLRLHDFVLAGLRVEALSADVADCRFDYAEAARHHRIKLTASGNGPGKVLLNYSDIEAFLLRKYRSIESISLKASGSAIEITGRGTFALVETSFHLFASLQPDGGSQINLTNARLFFDDRRADEDATRVVVESLNPIVDLDRDLKLLGAVQLARIKVLPNGIVAEGIAHFPVDPEAAPKADRQARLTLNVLGVVRP